MLSSLKTLAPLGLLIPNVVASRDDDGDDVRFRVDSTTIYDPQCTASVTVYNTTVVQKTQFVDYIVNITKTNTCYESTTLTLNYTVSVTNTDTDLVTITNTDTDLVTITNTGTDLVTITNTDTDSVTITNTDTDSVTITTTDTDAVTITTTDTDAVTITTTDTDAVTITTTDTDAVTITTTDTDSTTITRTVYTTTYDPCPKSCSISAASVHLYYWPTDRPYTYPTTYVDPSLSYTFTSPSVYMYIPSAQGVNTLGERVEPSTTNWILPLDLYEVSTIARGSNATRQLTLADLGTNCPQTYNPTAIATIPRDCDPMLAAPSQVRSWAYPCNACGRFGLFDPPYAVPTTTGLLGPSTVVVTAEPITVTAPPVVETSPPPPPPPPPVTTGALVIEYRDEDGNIVSATTIPTTGASGGTSTSTVVVAPTNTDGSALPTETGMVPEPSVGESSNIFTILPTDTIIPQPGETGLPTATTGAPDDEPPVEVTSLPTTTVATAAGRKLVASGSLWWVMPSVAGILFCL
ncbi:uncharacterized protein PODANS_5_6960 [Podospora anserina S mat+]|uniref:Podospora anserina S mat+ genomic DNA chromosome 5, supercontig 8 n=1 Tax=Podospora anserina (strain S / ATCC MYA-4624 / DSM 980 / FGSC 10383) TaxID=515849 RepID=B2AMJ1_PODAN|nr:uncharacterized protein PODANS_5_6960 [Podospora anserina S mat+]CAP65114.1 unnamed protein product [Podospora anserina S mat+]CDP29797.1 Putative protein of unknown function [Podospora anserina S mat+]